MDVNMLNLIVAMARLLGVPPDKLVVAFNEKDRNQEYYDSVIALQEISNAKGKTL